MSLSCFADEHSGHEATIRKPSISRYMHFLFKRCIDLFVCTAAAPAALFFICIAALLILLTMGRPIFFSQDRVGLNGRVFRMHKLRTMRRRDEDSAVSNATLVADPRITPLGSILRRAHIDEIPQLWNVFLGSMTLIGPRPEQPRLVEHYRSVLPSYDRRHTIKPGLSGWAQVKYGYAADAAETSVKLQYDLYYLANLSIWMDMRIALLTVRVFMNTRYVR